MKSVNYEEKKEKMNRIISLKSKIQLKIQYFYIQKHIKLSLNCIGYRIAKVCLNNFLCPVLLNRFNIGIGDLKYFHILSMEGLTTITTQLSML